MQRTIKVSEIPPLVHHIVKQMKGYDAEYLFLIGTEGFPLDKIIEEMYGHEKKPMPKLERPIVQSIFDDIVGTEIEPNLKDYIRSRKLKLEGKKILAVDAVSRSGGTIKEIKRVLEGMGAEVKTAVLAKGKKSSHIDFVGATTEEEPETEWKATPAAGLVRRMRSEGDRITVEWKQTPEEKKVLQKRLSEHSAEYLKKPKDYIKKHMKGYHDLNEHVRA